MNKVNRRFDTAQQIALFVVVHIADEIIRIVRGEIIIMMHREINNLHSGLFQHIALLKINRFRAAFNEKNLLTNNTFMAPAPVIHE